MRVVGTEAVEVLVRAHCRGTQLPYFYLSVSRYYAYYPTSMGTDGRGGLRCWLVLVCYGGPMIC